MCRTNINGAENIIDAAKREQDVVALSTDKPAPISLYGASKLASDKLFIAANNIAGSKNIVSVLCAMEILGSRGSVIPFSWKKNMSNLITHGK